VFLAGKWDLNGPPIILHDTG
jgi:hypothetical protein